MRRRRNATNVMLDWVNAFLVISLVILTVLTIFQPRPEPFHRVFDTDDVPSLRYNAGDVPH